MYQSSTLGPSVNILALPLSAYPAMLTKFPADWHCACYFWRACDHTARKGGRRSGGSRRHHCPKAQSRRPSRARTAKLLTVPDREETA